MKKIKLTENQCKVLLNGLNNPPVYNGKKVVTEFTDAILDTIKDFNEDRRLNKFNNFEKQIFFYQKGFGYIDKRFLKYVDDFRKYYFQTNNQTTRHLSNEEITRFLTKHYYIDIKPNIDDEDIIFKDDENTKSPFPKFDLIWMSNLRSINRDFNNPDIHSESVQPKRKILYDTTVLDKENREKKLKEETDIDMDNNYHHDKLDTPQNRKLLNFISKNINLENFNKSKQTQNSLQTLDNKFYNVRHFIHSVLFINDGTKMAELLWLIFLNGDINYLKDNLNTSSDFQIYIVNYWSSMDQVAEEKEVDCNECDGYGVEEEECNMCQGTGEEESGDTTDKEGQPIMVECPECEGEGEVSNDCDYCNGSGYEMEEFAEYVIEEWESTYLSLNKDIKSPSTTDNPNKLEPVQYLPWRKKDINKPLILINDKFVDEHRDEDDYYFLDKEDKIISFSSESLEDYGFEIFLKNFMYGE